MYNTIQFAVDEHVATITLNRPERKNAIGPEMVNELLHALEAVSLDTNIRVVVLGANGKVFSAGGDFAQMTAGGGGESALPVKGDYSDLLFALVRMKKPVIAKVQGAAMGGGLGLVCACSMAIASETIEVGTPEVNVGLFPMMIMAVLARTMPRRALLEMMLLGQKLNASEAARLGLINRAVAPERLDDEVKSLAQQLVQKSPMALARGLEAYGKMNDLALADALPWLRDELYRLLATDDAREGLTAFMEKRAPRWTGKSEPTMPTMRERVAELEARREAVRAMGGPDKIQKQHERGKLTARERFARFFDAGEFFEVGMHGTQMGMAAGPEGTDKPPADAVVCGFGKVEGRITCAAAYDFTVKGGSIGETGEVKVTRMRDMALKGRHPMVWFIDSGGARIDPRSRHMDLISQFAGTGHLFREQVIMSGVVPQVAAMVGPGAAGTAYIPGLADFVPMVKGIGSMALGGPALVKAVTGQEISEQDLGGSKVHSEVSGVGDAEVESDDACIALVRRYLSYFPSHCDEAPPRLPSTDPIERREESLLDIVPESTRRAYDMYKIIRAVVDHGELLDIKPRWARNVITCLARIGGRSVGIIANNPMHLGGVLDVDSADKAAHFVQVCDAFNIPLVFFQDTPGFMVGSKVEHAGVIRHGAKLLHTMSAATVPKLTVVVRKAYGAGYYVMCGRAYEPDLLVAWPGAEISVMGAEGMVGIAAAKLFGGAEPPPEVKKQFIDMLQSNIDVMKSAGWGLVDDVIDPRDTRRALAWGLEVSSSKQVERPRRKHGIVPV